MNDYIAIRMAQILIVIVTIIGVTGLVQDIVTGRLPL